MQAKQQAAANWQNQANQNYQYSGTTIGTAPQGAMTYTAANLFTK